MLDRRTHVNVERVYTCCRGDLVPPHLSGVITTTASFDRERQREFTLSVTATDQADEPLIGICQITVVIADQNDNDPKFENSRYQCESLQT